ncbi:hypothetical protein BOX15_Mlig008540g1 [Macrostomum lignano]|uniref:TPR_REGION domain-containing protein n=2 Tax=Macrostomum lignano TaxID=282301 RepID=A0A1I8FZZ2_9PLAT|nr:hypothetical protein BOX15_Mlig008540g1 [Macrostomum lignano]
MQCIESAYGLGESRNGAEQQQPPRPSLAAVYAAGCQALASEIHQTAERLKAEGNALMSGNRPLEAVAAYTRAIETAPGSAVYHCNRAAAYSKLGDHEAAIRDCELALAADPGYAKAYGRLGFAYAATGRHARAAEYYGRALQLEPNCVGYRQNLDTARAAAARADPTAQQRQAPQQQPQPDGRPRLPVDFQMMMNQPDALRHASQMVTNMAGHLPPSLNLSRLSADELAGMGREFASFLASHNPALSEQLNASVSRGGEGNDGTGGGGGNGERQNRPPDYFS